MSLETLAFAASIVVFAATMEGCGGKFAESMASRSGAPCPATNDGFMEGKATSADVKACLGEPFHKNYNKDGRYVFMYYSADDKAYTYLFKSDGTLSAIRSWSKK